MKLGRYEIIRELGKGARGIVYLAKDPLIGRLVALKTIRVGANFDEDEAREFQERFVREAQAAGILSHPNIVTVHDIGTDEETGNSFIAMEYVEGRNLKEILNQARPFSPEDAAEVLSQIAEALAFAHRKGIVHRDVKPANIIIRDDRSAKITDFGIAKIASHVANLTMTGQFLGTPNYMSPEQVKGGSIDGRSDIFALGVVLYEALTRQKPFGGDSLTTISYKIVHEQFARPSEIDPRIPEAFDEVVERCLQKNPADRYQSGSEVAEDLRMILSPGQPASAGESSVSESDGTIVDGPRESDSTGRDDDADTAPTVEPSEKVEDLQGELEPLVPWWKKPVRGSVAIATIGILLAALVLTSIGIWNQRVDVPPIDTEREARVAKQRDLRIEGQRLIREGNVEAAYETYFELRKLAPNSRTVGRTLRDLETLRAMRMSHEQKKAEAVQHLEEGRRLYDQKRYAQAIPFFEQAFHLDETLTPAVNYLRMSREQLSLQRMSSSAPAPTRQETSAQRSPAAETNEPITLLTLFDSPVSDGYFVVNVDGETVVHENLYEERWGFLKRRSPKQVSVYRQVAPDIDEIEVWVVVPSLNLQRRQSVKPSVEPGTLHRLVVTLDPDTKQIDLSFS
ncbi:MAG: protein kinase [Thermoanaerobaculia bacterium]|nr:protein kinase [Thermoanaerobaculia bacterium]